VLKIYWGEVVRGGSIAQHVINLSIRWRW
jgi:hypothetical protein